jgi:hypothetical protein
MEGFTEYKEWPCMAESLTCPKSLMEGSHVKFQQGVGNRLWDTYVKCVIYLFM